MPAYIFLLQHKGHVLGSTFLTPKGKLPLSQSCTMYKAAAMLGCLSFSHWRLGLASPHSQALTGVSLHYAEDSGLPFHPTIRFSRLPAREENGQLQGNTESGKRTKPEPCTGPFGTASPVLFSAMWRYLVI